MRELNTSYGPTLMMVYPEDILPGGKFIIPKHIKAITDRAFSSHVWDTLKVVEFNEGLEMIMCQAFKDCHLVKKIRLPSTIRTIIRHAFDGCLGITEVTIDSEFIDHMGNAFSNCKNIKKVNATDAVREAILSQYDKHWDSVDPVCTIQYNKLIRP